MKLAIILIWLTGTAVAQTDSVMKSVFSSAEGGGLDVKSSFWQKGGMIIADHDHMGRVVPGHRTVIRSRWTKQNLYLFFECPYEELSLRPNGTTDGRNVWALGLGRG